MGSALCSVAGLIPKASQVLMLLDDGLGMRPHLHTFTCNAKPIPTEWLVADLALASHCVPIITLSSAAPLQAAVESHPPDAIIVQVTFLGQVLEVLEESQHTTTVIVTGDRTGESKKHGRKVAAKIVTWEDVETSSAGPVSSTPPSELIASALCTSLLVQKLPVIFPALISTPTRMGYVLFLALDIF
jgi:long-chain acyl-CoA synthetase